MRETKTKRKMTNVKRTRESLHCKGGKRRGVIETFETQEIAQGRQRTQHVETSTRTSVRRGEVVERVSGTGNREIHGGRNGVGEKRHEEWKTRKQPER